MTELMDNVLILGKLTSGNIHYKPQDVDLIEFLKPLIKQFNLIQKDGRSLNFEIKGIPSKIFLDAKLLSHALENLISNAFKYSIGKGNPLLRVIFKPKELIVIVKDHGIGVPKAEISSLFQPFFRANNAAEIKGTGLGLSIAKEYVEVNKGQISAISVLGEGSQFEMTFKK
jgi:signal transduction histidine kinase